MAKPKRLTTPPARAPRSQDLPGMDTRAIPELEEHAREYADLRDRRMALTKDEATLKQQTIALLKKHHKTTYRRDGIELTLLTGEDGLRVRVKRDDDDEDDAPTDVAADDAEARQ